MIDNNVFATAIFNPGYTAAKLGKYAEFKLVPYLVLALYPVKVNQVYGVDWLASVMAISLFRCLIQLYSDSYVHYRAFTNGLHLYQNILFLKTRNLLIALSSGKVVFST